MAEQIVAQKYSMSRETPISSQRMENRKMPWRMFRTDDQTGI